MAARLTAEYAELVLHADGVITLGIERIRGTHVLFHLLVIDLQSHGRRVVIALSVVGHCDDGGLDATAGSGDDLLQVGRECGNAAAAR